MNLEKEINDIIRAAGSDNNVLAEKIEDLSRSYARYKVDNYRAILELSSYNGAEAVLDEINAHGTYCRNRTLIGKVCSLQCYDCKILVEIVKDKI